VHKQPIALLSAALLAAFIVAGVRFAHAGRQQAAKACPSGYVTRGEAEAVTGAWVDDVAMTQ
jgi:hypothetical protein